jgi:hypothetical protein
MTILLGIGIVLGFTKALTTYQFYRAKSIVGKREPPTVPYWMPWLGNLLPFILRQSLFLGDIVYAPSQTIPQS